MNEKRMKELSKLIMEEAGANDISSLQAMFKQMLKAGIETILEGELESELGYSKSDRRAEKSNYRNGSREKTVYSELGEIPIKVPRDRKGEYKPELIPNNSNDISEIESKIISMYAKGLTTRDISEHVSELYGYTASATTVSSITDKVIPMMKEWQNRPLYSEYAFVFLDAIHYKVRENARIINKAAYVVLGVDMDGFKEVLGIWVGENETSKFWLKVLNDLKNRGVNSLKIVCTDGLPGFSEAIQVAYPKAYIQRCIVHQIRYSTMYVSHIDKKEFTTDLKLVYTAVDEKQGFSALESFKKKWGEKYPTSVNSWYNNWSTLSTFFEFSKPIRKMIYTTNAVESLNRQYRKFTKTRAIFSSDTALMKCLYLSTLEVAKKWQCRTRNWDPIVNELKIICN